MSHNKTVICHYILVCQNLFDKLHFYGIVMIQTSWFIISNKYTKQKSCIIVCELVTEIYSS